MLGSRLFVAGRDAAETVAHNANIFDSVASKAGAREARRVGRVAAPIAAAKKGKVTAKMVAGASVALGGVMAMRNRSGRAADRVVGRPTGPYGY